MNITKLSVMSKFHIQVGSTAQVITQHNSFGHNCYFLASNSATTAVTSLKQISITKRRSISVLRMWQTRQFSTAHSLCPDSFMRQALQMKSGFNQQADAGKSGRLVMSPHVEQTS